MREFVCDIVETFKDEIDWTGASDCLCFSARMQSVYRAQLQRFDEDPGARQFRERYKHYDQRRVNPQQINDLADVAAEVWQLFPTHFYKVQHAFLSSCLPSEERKLHTTPFGATTLHVVDIGSGVGTASLAVVDLLMSWQTACFEAGHSPPQINVRIIPVEVNTAKAAVLQEMVACLVDQQEHPLVCVNMPETICQEFPGPQCSRTLSTALADGGHHLLVCLSNVLTWVRAWRPSLTERLGQWWRRLKRRLGIRTDAAPWPDYLTSAAALFASLPFDHKTILACETKAEGLAEELCLLHRCLRGHLQKPVYITPPTRTNVCFENPRGSFWRTHRGRYRVDYSYAQLTSQCHDFRREPRFLEALNDDKLRVAWARTRWLSWRSFLPDDLEVRLFEANLQWHLDRLRRHVISRDVPDPQTVGVCYDVPKSARESRCMTHSDFESSIGLVALLQASRQQIEASGPPVSFGNRLNPKTRDEYLYKYFLRQHRNFDQAVRRAARGCPGGFVTKLDILKYYDSIKLEALYDHLCVLLEEKNCRALSAWRRHLLSCERGTGIDPQTMQQASDRGIPQGHPTSGALANIYLRELDEYMWSDVRRGAGRFFRYVDDMAAITGRDEPKNAATNEVAEFLARPQCGLALNEDKTRYTPCKQFEGDYTGDLDGLNDQCRTVVRRAYRLPWSYASALGASEWEFCDRYSLLLRQIGIHASPRYLVRKLRPERSVLGRLKRRYWYGPPLRLPPLPDTRASAAWAHDVEERNEQWVRNRDQVGCELKCLAEASLSQVETGELDADKTKQAGKALRFASFRLSVIHAGDCGGLFETFLSKPWLVNPRFIAKGLAMYGQHMALIAGIGHENETVAACCASAAGEYAVEDAREELRGLATHGTHPLARSAAIAALMKLQRWTWDDRRDVRRALTAEQDPRPLASLICLGCAMGIPEIDALGHGAYLRTKHHLVLDAWAYAQENTGENLLSRADVPPPYYSAEYPDFEGCPEYYGLF